MKFYFLTRKNEIIEIPKITNVGTKLVIGTLYLWVKIIMNNLNNVET